MEPDPYRQNVDRYASEIVRSRYVKWLHTGSERDARIVRRAVRAELLFGRFERWITPYFWRNAKAQMAPWTAYSVMMLVIALMALILILLTASLVLLREPSVHLMAKEGAPPASSASRTSPADRGGNDLNVGALL